MELTYIQRKSYPHTGNACSSQWYMELALKSIHSLGQKININKYSNIQIIHLILIDQGEVKLAVNNKKHKTTQIVGN